MIIGADEGTFYKPHTHGDIRNFVVVTVRNSDIDGYAFSIGADAKAHLLDCEENRFPFVIDSFKSLTRNVSKLMLIMEFLLSRWIPFTTTNYLIMNGHIERRPKLLKAASTHEDMFKNWKQTAGLGKLHKLFLEKTVEQIKK